MLEVFPCIISHLDFESWKLFVYFVCPFSDSIRLLFLLLLLLSFILGINFYHMNSWQRFVSLFVGCLSTLFIVPFLNRSFVISCNPNFQFLLFPELLGTASESCCSCQYLTELFNNNFMSYIKVHDAGRIVFWI